PLGARPDGLASEVQFVIPDGFPAGTYSQAVLCPRCGPGSFGKTFYALDPQDADPKNLLQIGPSGGSASWYPWVGAGLVAAAALGFPLKRRQRPAQRGRTAP